MSLKRIRPYTFFYDYDCGFCVLCKWVAAALDFRGLIDFEDLGGVEADARLAFLSTRERYASSHLVCPDGPVASAGAGIVALARLLPLTAPLALLWQLVPGHRQLSERLYRLVADQRHRIVRGSTCGLQRPDDTATVTDRGTVDPSGASGGDSAPGKAPRRHG